MLLNFYRVVQSDDFNADTWLYQPIEIEEGPLVLSYVGDHVFTRGNEIGIAPVGENGSLEEGDHFCLPHMLSYPGYVVEFVHYSVFPRSILRSIFAIALRIFFATGDFFEGPRKSCIFLFSLDRR